MLDFTYTHYFYRIAVFLMLSLLNKQIVFSQEIQDIITKDSVISGVRPAFMKGCVQAASKSMIEIKGKKINAYKYCSCVCDNLIPRLYSSQLFESIENESFYDLLQEPDNLDVILNCLGDDIQFKDEFKLSNIEDLDNQKKVGINACILKIKKDSLSNTLFKGHMAENYCTCAFERLISMGFTLNEISDIGDPNSKAFNEVALPCVKEVFAKEVEANNLNINTNNIDSVITGGEAKCSVPLLDYMGKGYKLKLKIGGITNYFFLDTGASDILIDKKFEEKLKESGVIKEEDYLDDTQYIMADMKIVNVRMVKLNEITIGDYTVQNVRVAIIDKGLFLCGKSFLEKFKKWEIDKEEGVLNLYK